MTRKPEPAETTSGVWEISGQEAFERGDKRIVPRDVLVEHGADAARAWYRGWDNANMAKCPFCEDGVCTGCNGTGIHPLAGVGRPPEIPTDEPCSWCEGTGECSFDPSHISVSHPQRRMEHT